ncbi:MAG: helix-turn-helix transcriptional regulator [Proteobacteria bacterium]|nr:helix-turn-helix transcriptional regulator [Pseudomonadota bacterium]
MLVYETRGITPSSVYLPEIIAHLGEDDFGQALISFLNAVVGAEHCTVFRLDGLTPDGVVAVSHDGSDTARRQCTLYLNKAYWRRDTFLSEAQSVVGTSATSLCRMGVAELEDRQFSADIYGATHVGERILLCGGLPGSKLGVSILRPEDRGNASDEELYELAALSSTLVSLLGKHVALLDSRADLSLALTSIDHIEATFCTASTKLPRREAEVCARTVLGVSTAGISAELGIGEETVMTYRKRAYQRLGIASQRELLLWYVAEWGSCRPRHRSTSRALAA